MFPFARRPWNFAPENFRSLELSLLRKFQEAKVLGSESSTNVAIALLAWGFGGLEVVSSVMA